MKTRKNNKHLRKPRSKKQKGGMNDADYKLIEGVNSGDIDMVRESFIEGADPNTTNDSGGPLLLDTVIEGTEFVKLFLEKGADPNAKNKFERNGSTVLMDILSYSLDLGNSEIEIVKLLLEKGADPNIATRNGETALMLAIFNEASIDNFEIVKLLLEKGADPNITSSNSNTLIDAIDYDNDASNLFEIIKLLLEKGAYIEYYNANNIGIDIGIVRAFRELLLKINEDNDNREKWLELLNKYPKNMNVNVNEGKYSPLMEEVYDCSSDKNVQFLLELKGLDVNYSVSTTVVKHPITALDVLNEELDSYKTTSASYYSGCVETGLLIQKLLLDKGAKLGKELFTEQSNKHLTHNSNLIEEFEYVIYPDDYGDWDEDDEEEEEELSQSEYDDRHEIIRHKLSIITIPKGTVLFRKSKDLNSDYCGSRNNEENPANYNVPTDLNVFFYFYPYYGDTVDVAQGTNKMFILTQDIKLLNLTYPSSINRKDRNNYYYNDIFVSCRSHDPCFTDDFKKKHPDILGFLAIAENDAEEHVRIYYNQDKKNKDKTNYPSFYSVLWEDNRIKGSPEIILYPFQERFLKEIHHSIDECKKIPNNYELLAESTEENSIVSQLNEYLSPKGKNGKHITIFTPLKLFVVYEELDDKYKKSCTPLIMDVKSKLQVFQTEDLYKNDLVPFHKRDISPTLNTEINKTIFNMGKKGGRRTKKRKTNKTKTDKKRKTNKKRKTKTLHNQRKIR